MRQTRRGCFAAQGGGAKYVWAVYNLAYGIDESAGGTDGSVSLSSSRYKMAAKGYTISDSGTVTLTDPTKTTAANLAVGDYLVNVSTSNSTATTGDTLYKVTGVSGSYNYTISYTAYTPALNARGTDTGQRVESNTADDYPVDGVQGDYYYVMVKGYGTVYVWDVFNKKTSYGYKESTREPGYNTIFSASSTIYYSSSYNFNTATGKWTILNPSSGLANALSTGTLSGKYLDNNTTSEYIFYSPTKWEVNGSHIDVTATRCDDEIDRTVKVPSKGSATGRIVESLSQSAYPQDGAQGDYWYTYNSSYTGWFDFT